jgi:phosphatidylserine/phosphatidylglycerophosphate/cardiolipin synthase-like enzyme
MKGSVILEGKTCHVVSTQSRAQVLVDAESYYSAFCEAALGARRYIYITGWQFDTRARLLRPPPGAPPPHPIELLPFLNYLCEATPALEIFITAWDYSMVYALEREWLQKLRFDFQSHPRVHFEFLNHPEPGGCHHQKLVIVDGRTAYLGGLDLCDSRWDTRQHTHADPARIDMHGKPYKPFHDIQVAIEGPAVARLERLFLDGWRLATGLELNAVHLDPDAPPPSLPLRQEANGAPSKLTRHGIPISADRVAISRTEWTSAGTVLGEIQALFERAILAAERLIYIETQYFTSKALAEALYYRLAAPERSKLELVIVMPDGADSPKEDFVLGNRQRSIRRFIADVARHFGHEFRLLMSSESNAERPCPATFIHSKLMVVDDEFLTIGSANFTNRSMRIDRELNVAWQVQLEDPASGPGLGADIRALRASLLAEHAGAEASDEFLEIDGLVARLDAVCAKSDSKLRCQSVPAAEDDDPLLIAIFDPSGPIDWSSIDQSLEDAFQFDEGFVKRTAQKIGQRLGVVDIDE